MSAVRSLWLARLPVLALSLLAFGSLPACKSKTGPSPHYDRGAALHQQLFVRLLDDAYLDPRMDEAARELKLVETTSLDYPNAVELLAQIDKGRKDAAAARDARARSYAEMEKGLKAPSGVFPSIPDSAPPPPPPAAAPAAGPVVADPFGPGALIADINKATGGCLVSSGPFREEGGADAKQGLAYKLVETPACKDKLPGFVGQVVLSVEGKVYRRISSDAARVEETKKADAGTPAPAAPTKAAAPAAPAAPVPPIPGAAYRTEGPPAFEGQKDAPKAAETAPAKMEDSTPQPAK